MTGRVVAELGRPETASETAARKAESSRIYRSSQNVRNLVAGLIATLAVVAIIVFAVPRGDLRPQEAIDAPAIAEKVSATTGHTALVPALPDLWRVNRASLEGGAPAAWTVVYAPTEESPDTGFVTFAQVFGGTDAWVPSNIAGASADGTVAVDGVEWTEFTVRASEASRNVSYALGTQAGDDYIVLYGAATHETTQRFAADLAPQIAQLIEGAE